MIYDGKGIFLFCIFHGPGNVFKLISGTPYKGKALRLIKGILLPLNLILSFSLCLFCQSNTIAIITKIIGILGFFQDIPVIVTGWLSDYKGTL